MEPAEPTSAVANFSFVEKSNPVYTSTKYVVERSEHVHINTGAIVQYAEAFVVPEHTNWMRDSFGLEDFSTEELAMLSTVFNSISFSYWGDPYWSVEYKGVSHDRASWSLVAAILRSKEEGKSLLDPAILANLSVDELGEMLRGNTEIPMLCERADILTNVGKKIQEKGSIISIVEEADKDALALVKLIQEIFLPAFDDQYEYKGKTVQFNKRAQALVESLHSIFDGKGSGIFTNVNELSALADYIIPNLLREAGILMYSTELAGLIDNKTLIEKGSAYEVELRASVIWAIEWLREEISKRLGHSVETAAVNDGLWLAGGDIKTPFHLVRTTAY